MRMKKTFNDMPDILDAAKRKTLPVWIREGLEKMEREKQKKMEKEQVCGRHEIQAYLGLKQQLFWPQVAIDQAKKMSAETLKTVVSRIVWN